MIYPGLKINDYIIMDELGRGGFGSVFLAKESQTNHLYAIKFLHPKTLRSDESRQAFIDEMINQARLSLNPNIVHVVRSVRHSDNQGEHLGMVMEYVDGDPLDIYIQRFAPLPDYVASPIFIQVLNGLGYAHHQSMLHRDMKPGNIMIRNDGLIKLMDFGLSKVVRGSHAASESARAASLNYVAPERLEKSSIDARTDIYSVGATLYEALAGVPPYDIEFGDWQAATAKHKSGAFRSIRDFYPHHSEAMETIVRNALNPDPRRRYSDCQDFMEDLITVWESLPVPGQVPADFQRIIDVTKQIVRGEYEPARRQRASAGSAPAARPAPIATGSSAPPARRFPGPRGPSREERLEEANAKITALFRARNYTKALEQIDEMMNWAIYVETAGVREIRERIEKILKAGERIEAARRDKNYEELRTQLRAVADWNSHDTQAKREHDFVLAAAPYLSEEIFIHLANNEMDIEQALGDVRRLLAEPIPHYKADLQRVLDSLQTLKRDKEKRIKVETITKDILNHLYVDEYQKILPLVEALEKLLDKGEKPVISLEKCLEAISLEANLHDTLQQKDYTTSAKLAKKLYDINTRSEGAKERSRILSRHAALKKALQSATNAEEALRAIKEATDRAHGLPPYLVDDLNDLIVEKRNLVRSERERLIAEAEEAREAKKWNAALVLMFEALELEPDPQAASRIEDGISELKSLRARSQAKRLAVGFVTAAAVLAIAYLATGPIPQYLEQKRIVRELSAPLELVSQAKYAEAAAALKIMRAKEPSNKSLEREISKKFATAFDILIKEADASAQGSRFDQAIVAAEMAVAFAGEEKQRRETEDRIHRFRRDQALATAKELFAARDYVKAAAAADEALKYDEALKSGHSGEAAQILKDANYESNLAAGKKAYDEKRLEEAYGFFQKAKGANPTPAVEVLLDKIGKDKRVAALQAGLAQARRDRDSGQMLRMLVDLKKERGESISDPFDLLLQTRLDDGSGIPEIVIGGIEFVFVEGGEFRMGCFDMADALKNPEITSEALPVHSVSLDGFWLSKTEISRGQYGALSSSDAVYPVVNVEWDKARRFAEGLGRRVSGGAEYTLKTDLPTEAQWEYAARNRGNEIPYPGGWDTDCEDANFKVCRRPLMAAKSLDPSPLGLYHIVGNAREWCRDTYDATVYQKHEEQVSVKNPFVSYASGSNTYRVVRGGSFGDDKPGLKTYIRTQREASVPDSQTGFRVVIER